MPSRRSLLAAPLAMLAVPRILRAQTGWPTERPIKVIVPFPPSGGVDTMVRAILTQVAPRLPGARFVVANRPGAGGQLGFEANFNAAPDGHTLGAVTNTAMNAISIERAPRYRPADFTYIANVVDDPNCFFVRADSPIRSLGEFVAAARAQPGKLNYGTTGVGSDDHILMLHFEALAKLPPLVHVPFAGGAPVMQALLGGHLELAVGNMSDGLSLVREGRIRYLGGAMAQRWSALPEVPTFREQGFDLVAGASRGIVGPPGLPDPIRLRLEAAFAAALADPAFLKEAERLSLPLRR
ncbi:MAG: tripartite tricarboxylate transporter substrate binding protein [Acetobacteraceae bacterium]|nr:tripartite tricarboxylate transporter substrate binding protein [Acetobacteraceae bacterium]